MGIILGKLFLARWTNQSPFLCFIVLDAVTNEGYCIAMGTMFGAMSHSFKDYGDRLTSCGARDSLDNE